MTFLLDTNAVSEWVKPHPDPGIIAWLDEVDEDRVFLSVVTIAELRHGIDRLPRGRRRNRLEYWLGEDLPLRFDGRILPIDPPVAEAWGRTMAQQEARGRPIGTMDAFIAATATVHALALVTRNTSDFEAVLPAIVNPWTG